MKRIVLCALALAGILTVAGCVRSSQEGPAYLVYFLSEEVGRDQALVPEARTLSAEDDPVEGLLTILLEGPESEDLTPAIPVGVTLRGWTLEDGLLTVDFSARYASLSGVDLTLADYSVVATLCQLDSVETVEIKVDGDYLTYRDHQRMTAEDTWSVTQPAEAETGGGAQEG